MANAKPVQRFSPKITRLWHNRRRVNRMDVWLNLADDAQEEMYHVQFVFLWIAYEAAWQKQSFKVGSGQPEKFFNHVSTRNSEYLQAILKAHKKTIEKLFNLRWASKEFWFKNNNKIITTPEQWECHFVDHVTSLTDSLQKAINDGSPQSVSSALENLFSVLRIVRNQIVHGASAGKKSLGKRQVKWGVKLLASLIPCFRKIIDENIREDWGIPPFAHVAVGVEPNQDYPPPWLSPRK